MINHNSDEFTPYFCADMNDVIFTFLSFCNHQLKKVSMQPTSILCLNHIFRENRFNKKFLTRLSVNRTNSFSKTVIKKQPDKHYYQNL